MGNLISKSRFMPTKFPSKSKDAPPPANPRTKNKAAGNKGYTETKFTRNMLTFT